MGEPIDLGSPEFRANPYPTYEALRRAGGVQWQPHGGVTGGMWECFSHGGAGADLLARSAPLIRDRESRD